MTANAQASSIGINTTTNLFLHLGHQLIAGSPDFYHVEEGATLCQNSDAIETLFFDVTVTSEGNETCQGVNLT